MFTLVITTHNNVRHLALAIASARRLHPEIPIVVVDHASSDETQRYSMRMVKGQKGVTYIGYEGPRNLAKMWNLGIAQVKTRYAIVSNDDVAFVGDFESIIQEAMDHPQISMVLPSDNSVLARYSYPAPPAEAAQRFLADVDAFSSEAARSSSDFLGALDGWWNSCRHLVLEGSEIICSPYHPSGGFCFAIDLERHERVGPFDEVNYTYYGEDWEYFARTLRHFKIRHAHGWFVWHFGQRTGRRLGDGGMFDALMRARFQLIEDHEGRRELVSVVIPNRGRVQELQVAVRSVLAQTCQEWRLYVVDDASPNVREIGAMLEAFRDPRIGMWKLQEGRGPGGARNFGIERTRGKYIALLDSDDWWAPGHLEAHIGTHEGSLISMTYSDMSFAWRWWDEKTKRFQSRQDKMPTIEYFGPFDRARLEAHNYILTSSTVWFGDTLRAIRFPEDRRIEEDWEAFKACPDPIEHIGLVTVRYHQQPGAGNLMEEAGALSSGSPHNPAPGLLVAARRPFRGASFSVVIPTKDRPDLLRRAIASAGGHCPVIVVIDGQDGHTAALEACEGFDHVSVAWSDGDGPSAARNTGVSIARTEWVKFLDDDDVLVPGWLHVHERASKEADVLSCDAAVPAGGEMLIHGEDASRTSMLAFRRSCLVDLGGFDEGIRIGEEIELLVRAAKLNLRRSHVPAVCVVRARIASPVPEWTPRGKYSPSIAPAPTSEKKQRLRA